MSELYHHGVKDQKWGIRNGPPYPLYRQTKYRNSGSYKRSQANTIKNLKLISARDTASQTRGLRPKYSRYSKKHVDTHLQKGTTLQTLSLDPNRFKSGQMVYTTHNWRDKLNYAGTFNKKLWNTITNENGDKIGSKKMYRMKLKAKIAKDMSIASEDSGNKSFEKLMNSDADFRNFVIKRMPQYVRDIRYAPKVNSPDYKDAWKALEKASKVPLSQLKPNEIRSMYKMFNFTIPNDGKHSKHLDPNKVGKDIENQRSKFFNDLKKNGYSGLLDTNDALYRRGNNTNSPVIIFDLDSIIPTSVKQMNTGDVALDIVKYGSVVFYDTLKGMIDNKIDG